MKKRIPKLLSALLCFVMLLSLLPITASAAGGVTAESKYGVNKKIYFSVDDAGVLTWSSVPGATGYDLQIRHDGDFFREETGNTSLRYELQAELNKYKKESKAVEVYITPKGENCLEYADQATFTYVSPYPKLESPSGLLWYGDTADWNDVPGADSYLIYLYKSNATAYNHWTTEVSEFDFSNVPEVEEGWYFTVKAQSTGSYRDSEYTEGPRKPASVSTTLHQVGAYVYNETLGEQDSGGEVYMSTAFQEYDWSGTGYTDVTLEDTSVTVKARPADGYEFVEWRQGTQGSTVSTDAEYTYTCTGYKYLYAIFRQEGVLTPITGVALTGLSAPVVGESIEYVDGSDLEEHSSGANQYRVIDNQTCTWRDEEGRPINYGAQVFEAGRTYSISFNVDPKDGYAFTSADIPVEMYNLYDGTYVGSIALSGETSVATVTITFELDGERTYADISTFRFYDMRAPKDGDTVNLVNGVWAYNNSEMTDRYWTDAGGNRLENGTKFEGGATYYYNYIFTAFDGYKFADALSIRADNVEPEDWEYTFQSENTQVHIEIPYYVGGASVVSSVTVDGMFLPAQGGYTRMWDSNVYLSVPNDANYSIPLQTKSWYEVTAEYPSDTQYKVEEKGFYAGKQYKMFLIVHAEDGYKFAAPENLTFAFSGISADAYTYTVSEGGSEGIIEVAITFTVPFPDGYGSDANMPVWCYSYIELKTALESNDIRYVALGDVEDVLPAIPHDEEQDPGGVTTTAIVVRGDKDLNLLGDALFRCPLTGKYDLKYYIQLITLTDAADSALYIHGPGSLTYAGGTLVFVNSAIKVEGGHLTVDGTTVRGSNGYHTAFCYGINALSGSVSIQNGATVIGEIYGGDGGISAMTLGEEGGNYSLSVSIWDGKFYVERDEGDSDEDHGIMVNNDIGLRIYGMTTDGIDLGRYAAETLDEYIMDGSIVTVNGVKTDPASCGSTDGIVEVYKAISEVDIHVNAPTAHKTPAMYAQDVYLVPEGCTAKDPVWYEDGEPWNLSTGGECFEAGSTYKVEITLVADEGMKFADPLTSATVNYKTAEVSAYGGNAENGVVLTLDLGECPDTVDQVKLTVAPPRQYDTPAQRITCGNSTYRQALVGDNMWDVDAYWMESVYEPDEDSDWEPMDPSDTFTVGYYYRVALNLMPEDGFEFAIDHNIDPAVSATVNGNYAEVGRYPEADPSELIWVQYDFGKLNDTVIDVAKITDVTEPTVGELPVYTCSLYGTGYVMDPSEDLEEDGVGCIKNGMGWWDVTADDWLRENEPFRFGREYKLYVYVKAEENSDYTFSDSTGPGTATINGVNAEYISAEETSRALARTFTCAARKIKMVEITGLTPPAAGEHPDYTVTMAQPEYYQLDEIVWYDGDMEEMTPESTFQENTKYRLRIIVTPVEVDGEEIGKFILRTGDAKMLTGATLNGTPVQFKRGEWDEVTGSPGRLTVWYTFTGEPVITEHPEDRTAAENQVVYFNVTAACGTGTLSYQWQYRTEKTDWTDTALTGYDTNSLRVTATPALNGRQYHCIVTDEAGETVTSNAATLTVAGPLQITAQPENQTVTPGEKAQFTVGVSGVGLKYQWQYSANGGSTWNNSTLTGYNTHTLTVTASAAINGRLYHCFVTDGGGKTVTSNGAKLIASTVLQITSQPTDRTAVFGERVQFTVAASGTGLTYQWQYSANGGNTWNNTTLAGYNTHTLTVTASTAINGRQYHCIVTDSKGGTVTSDPATLTLPSTVKITAHPEDQTVASGAKAKFTVTASGTGLKYQWQYRTAKTDWTDTALTGYDTPTLTVTAGANVNGRQYRCAVTDVNGYTVTSKAATLTLPAAVKITAHPENQTVAAGEKAKFTVAASGSGLTYQWQYSANGGSTWNNTTLTGYNTHTLTVTASANVNGRQYRCVVTDANGDTVTSNGAKLTVETGPKITSQPEDQNVASGETAKFTVGASGTGLKYQWQYSANGGSTWADTALTGYNTATLTVTASANVNGRQYRCVVTDANGDTVTSNGAKLTVETGPKITSQPEDQNVAAGVKAKFTVGASGSGLEYRWQYSANGGATWNDTSLSGYNTATLTVTASSNVNGRQYRCVVTDANGETVTSDAAKLTVG